MPMPLILRLSTLELILPPLRQPPYAAAYAVMLMIHGALDGERAERDMFAFRYGLRG